MSALKIVGKLVIQPRRDEWVKRIFWSFCGKVWIGLVLVLIFTGKMER